MAFPRPSPESKSRFDAFVPDDPRVTVKPMFGNFAAFVNGNMFLGLFGEDAFIRLAEEDRAELLKIDGTSRFEPMKGRPMKEYVGLPSTWNSESQDAAEWIGRSLAWVGEMPAKKPKKRSKRARASKRGSAKS